MAKLTNPPPPTAKASSLTIDVTPSSEAREALTLRNQAASLIVTDRASHSAALEFIRGAKKLKRAIEEHWSRITRSVDDLKANLLNLKRQDLGPVDEAIAAATQISLAYENAENRRALDEQNRVRAAAQKKADDDRAEELERIEQQALRAENSSKDLSGRELAFVDYFTGPYQNASRAAQQAGYKDPDGQAARLLKTPKIVKAIAAKRQAIELREQAEAKRQTPVEVVVPKVEAQIGRAAGVSSRKTYGGDVVDLDAFKRAVVNGVIGTDYILPNGPALNKIASQAPALFEQAFPGCALRTNQTIAG